MNKDFKYLLFGQFISVLGERISTLVFFSIAVSLIGNESSLLASLLLAIQFTPLFILGYIFGIFADKYNQKIIMIIADLFRALFLVLLLFNLNSLFLLYSVVFFIGLFTALFEPSKKSLIPFIVEKKDLIKMNRIFALSEIFAIFCGLLLGSLFLEFFTFKQALIINIFTYLFSLVLILFINYKFSYLKTKNKEFIFKNFKLGLNYLKKNYNSRHVLLNITLINFLAAGFNFSSISSYTINNSLYKLDPGTQIGIFLLLIAFGALTSPILNNISNKFKLKDSTIVSYSFLFGGLMTIFISILMYFNQINFYNISVFFFLSGILVGTIYTKILYLIHLNTDKNFYGRIISINDLISSSMTILGIILGGLIVDHFNFWLGFFITGLIFIIGFIYFKIIDKKISW